MKNILDTREFNTQVLLKQLKEAQFDRVYETQKNDIIVEESPVVAVKITNQEGRAVVKAKFPQIGNQAQILATTLLLISGYFINHLSSLAWIIAITGGQLVSFLFYYPKIKALKHKIESVLR
jgi:hypothetical protein